MIGENITVSRVVEAKDFIYASLVAVLCIFLLPSECLTLNAQSSILGMAISVLSILFAIFFAALGIIISVPSKDFIDFANKKKALTRIIGSFEWTLIALFVALIFSIVIWSYIQLAATGCGLKSPGICLFSLFVFLFVYSLLSAFISSIDCTKMIYRYLEYLHKLDSLP